MDFSIIIENLPLYLEGLWITVQLVVLASVSYTHLTLPTILLV